MNDINHIKQQEVSRGIPGPSEESHQEIIRKSGSIPIRERISQVVLGTAILILGLFFFYISAEIKSTAFLGLGIMAGTLGMRMGLEFAMIKKISFPIDEAMTHYKRQLTRYYQARKQLHFIVTPLLFAAYIYGFVMLLSNFEQELPGEFYTYVIYSSWVVLLGLAVLIGIQLKKELELLKSLIADDGSTHE